MWLVKNGEKKREKNGQLRPLYLSFILIIRHYKDSTLQTIKNKVLDKQLWATHKPSLKLYG